MPFSSGYHIIIIMADTTTCYKYNDDRYKEYNKQATKNIITVPELSGTLEISQVQLLGDAYKDITIQTEIDFNVIREKIPDVEKSGNRTVRLIFDTPVADGEESDRVLKELVARGCSYEGSSRRYIAVNIPPSVNLGSIRAYLIECGANWEHADPRYSELFPDDVC